VKTKNKDPILTRFAMREIYERNFYIHDHQDAHLSAFNLCVLHPKENTTQFSRLYREIHRYIANKVGDATKMGLTEFLDMPREYCEIVYQILEAESDISKDVLKDLGLDTRK
jgi:hypothetical protein